MGALEGWRQEDQLGQAWSLIPGDGVPVQSGGLGQQAHVFLQSQVRSEAYRA